MHSTMILVGSDVQEGVLVDEAFPCKSIVDHFNLIISGCYWLNETLNRIRWWIFLFSQYLETRPGRGRSVQHWRECKKSSHVCFWFNSLI